MTCQRDDDQHPEKRLSQTGVENSDLVFQQGDAQTAEHTLENDGAERGPAEIAHPATRLDPPNPDRENDGEKTDRRSDQAVGVLEKNSADPF